MELEAKQERYNELVSRIVTNKGVTTSAIYQIGLDLKEIQERELYLLDCRDFKEFLRTRVDLEKSTAYLAIEMAKTYSITEFNKWGLARLMLIKRQIHEQEDRQDFMKSHPIESIRQTKSSVQEYALDKGIKELTKFEGQAGSRPNYSEDDQEFELRLIRQANDILRFKDSLIKSLENWLEGSKDSKNQEVISLKGNLKKILECLK